jgi:hypothetical protein
MCTWTRLAADLVKGLRGRRQRSPTDRLNDLARAASNIQAQEGKLDMLPSWWPRCGSRTRRRRSRASSSPWLADPPAEAARVAVQLVDGETLRAFTDFGYSAGARPNDVPLDSYAALKKVVTDRPAPASGSTPGTRLPGRAAVSCAPCRGIRRGGGGRCRKSRCGPAVCRGPRARRRSSGILSMGWSMSRCSSAGVFAARESDVRGGLWKVLTSAH